MMPGMGYKNYIYAAFVIAAVCMKYTVEPIYGYLNQPLFGTDLGMFTVFTAITGVALAFFSASLSDNMLRFVETSSRNSFTTFLAAGIFLVGFITTVDIIVAFVTESDMFMLQTVVDLIKDPTPFTDVFMIDSIENSTINNSTLME